MKFQKLFIIIFLLTYKSLCSDEITNEPVQAFGLFGHYNLNLHSADFKELPNVENCCPKFVSGIGNGFSLGALYSFPINKKFTLELRSSYSVLDATFIETEDTYVMINGNIQKGEFEHTLETNFSNIGIETQFGYIPIENLTIRAGLRLGYMMSKTYYQIEKITKSATFADEFGADSGIRTRNESSGDISNVNNYQLFSFLGISYDLPLNREGSLMISPEAYYYTGRSPVIDGYNWNINYLAAGIAIKYILLPKPVIVEERIKILKNDTIKINKLDISEDYFVAGLPKYSTDTTLKDNIRLISENIERTDTIFTKKKYKIFAEIRVAGIDSLGNEIENPIFLVEEFKSTQFYPLLNYIFFDNNSSKLPDRYIKISKEESSKFFPAKLHSYSTLQVYYQILNIVGRRLRSNPKANIKIVGCNSNINSERNNKTLSKKRINEIKSYLIDVWNISGKRIKIEVRNLPAKPSTPSKEPDKIAENRRVELYSNMKEILAPVLIADTLRQVLPPILKFYPSFECEAGLKNLTISTKHDGRALKTISFTKNVPKSVDWIFDNDQLSIPKSKEPIKYQLTVTDNVSNVFETKEQSVKVDLFTIEKKSVDNLIDKTYDRYSLILFDFNKSEIGRNNKEIAEFIRNRTKDNSTISIAGYTDRTGDELHNKKLSLQRAESTAKVFRRDDIKVEGIGEDVLLYDNTLPEGRFYCRTVNILVVTPFEK